MFSIFSILGATGSRFALASMCTRLRVSGLAGSHGTNTMSWTSTGSTWERLSIQTGSISSGTVHIAGTQAIQGTQATQATRLSPPALKTFRSHEVAVFDTARASSA